MKKFTGLLFIFAISFLVINSLLTAEEVKGRQKAVLVQEKINTQTQKSSSQTGVATATTSSSAPTAIPFQSPTKKIEKPAKTMVNAGLVKDPNNERGVSGYGQQSTIPSDTVSSPYSPAKKFEKPDEIGTVPVRAQPMKDAHWVYVTVRKHEGREGPRPTLDIFDFVNSTDHILPEGLNIYYTQYYEQAREDPSLHFSDDTRISLLRDLQPGEYQTLGVAPNAISSISGAHYLTSEYTELMEQGGGR